MKFYGTTTEEPSQEVEAPTIIHVSCNLLVSENRVSSMKKITVLFLSADPSDSTRLRLGQELRDIREKLNLSKQRDKFCLEARESVRIGDLTQALFNVEPTVVHFSGHGSKSGELCFEDALGKTRPADTNALAALFELESEHISCVVLNACFSEAQAQAIANHVPFVIGMSQAISDKAAILFSAAFYKALGAGRTFEQSYKVACVEIRLEGFPEHSTPTLYKKSNVYLSSAEAHHKDTESTFQPSLKENLTSRWRQHSFLRFSFTLGLIAAGTIVTVQSVRFLKQNASEAFAQSVDINHTDLQNFLKDKQWEKADQETRSLIIESGDTDQDSPSTPGYGWLDSKEIEAFPCDDLQAIDQLWTHYSNGRFGFSAQNSIFIDTGNETTPWKEAKLDQDTLRLFGKRVGWISNTSKWKTSSELNFVSRAPKGHLPFWHLAFADNSTYEPQGSGWWEMSLFSSCEL